MAGAFASLDDTFNADETVEVSGQLFQRDDTAFPWADYAFGFAVGPRGCGATETGVQGDGRMIADAGAAVMGFRLAPGALHPGQHWYEINATHTATGAVIAVVDGIITISGRHDR